MNGIGRRLGLLIKWRDKSSQYAFAKLLFMFFSVHEKYPVHAYLMQNRSFKTPVVVKPYKFIEYMLTANVHWLCFQYGL